MTAKTTAEITAATATYTVTTRQQKLSHVSAQILFVKKSEVQI